MDRYKYNDDMSISGPICFTAFPGKQTDNPLPQPTHFDKRVTLIK